MTENCTGCHGSSQEVVIREDFLEELLCEEIGGVQGRLKPLTLACNMQLCTFLPNSAFSDQTGHLKLAVI